MRKYTVYTHGSCFGNPGPGGWAALLIDEKTGRKKLITGSSPETTGNRMELTAAIMALGAIRPGCSVRVVSNSQWVKEWIEQGGVGGRPNGDLWRELLALAESHDTKFEWIRDLCDNPFNEYVNFIATEEAQKAKEYAE